MYCSAVIFCSSFVFSCSLQNDNDLIGKTYKANTGTVYVENCCS